MSEVLGVLGVLGVFEVLKEATYWCVGCPLDSPHKPASKLFDKYQIFVDGEIAIFYWRTASKCEECMKKHLGSNVAEYYDFVPCADPTKLNFGIANFKPGINLSEINNYCNLGPRPTDK